MFVGELSYLVAEPPAPRVLSESWNCTDQARLWTQRLATSATLICPNPHPPPLSRCPFLRSSSTGDPAAPIIMHAGGPRPPASPPSAARKRCRRPAGRVDDSVGCCPWPTMLPPRPLPHTMEPELLRLVPPWRSSVWSYRAQRVGEAARRPRPTEAHPTPPLPTKPHLYLHSRAPPPLSVPSLFSRHCRGIVCESCARKPHLHTSIKTHSDDGALSSPP